MVENWESSDKIQIPEAQLSVVHSENIKVAPNNPKDSGRLEEIG